ncbi:MAG: tRNA 4-thiouridine(8) synthase ThiI [Clostridia bacterium]|nr:tRNA 4-thiouridine(8) synthase ThiI [Clostridia bacterium]
MIKRVILASIGEIALKGLNKSTFEYQLARNMRAAIKDCGKCDVSWAQSRFFVRPESESFNFELALKRLSHVFGLTFASIAYENDEVTLESAIETAKASVAAKLDKISFERELTDGSVKFKCETKRAFKNFPLTSPEISAEVGGALLDAFPELAVNVNEPDFIVRIEMRENVYVFSDIVKAPGGMPTGSNGRACLLLSGGIDSPVAGYMIGKRGVSMVAVHFFSYPYTGERSKEKVIELAGILERYCGELKVYVVPFTDIQLSIRDNCREDLGTILMRRSMMRIAERVAREKGCQALVTGESIGQVASQTMKALVCTNAVVNMPVFRPLIGMDKVEVMALAREIDTYDTSILPYEDCCTVFTPKHPKTRPNLDEVEKEENRYEFAALEDEAFRGIEECEYGG